MSNVVSKQILFPIETNEYFSEEKLILENTNVDLCLVPIIQNLEFEILNSKTISSEIIQKPI